MARSKRCAAILVAGAMCLTVFGPGVGAQAPPTAPPVPKSGAPAKELAGLLQKRSLTVFAIPDPDQAGRFVAVFHVPGVQLMVVAALHGKPSDIEYWLKNKDFMSAYADLNASVNAKERVFFEDTMADGLRVTPVRTTPPDVFTTGGVELAFDGGFADGRRRNDTRISRADYYKAFLEADERYTRLLGLLAEALKKQGA